MLVETTGDRVLHTSPEVFTAARVTSEEDLLKHEREPKDIAVHCVPANDCIFLSSKNILVRCCVI